MSISILYNTTARAVGGRDGYAETLDGQFHVNLAAPKELGGTKQGNNPEQLFAAGYAACFLGAMKYVILQEKLSPLPAESFVTANVGVGPRSEGGFGLSVALEVHLPGLNQQKAHSLIRKTEDVCPYVQATKGNIQTTIKLI